MKLGLVARADRTGLAVQTWSLWRHLRPHRTLIVDLKYCSGQAPETHRYGGESDQVEVWHTRTYPDEHFAEDDQVDAFLDDVDIVFTAETPYNYWLFDRAREKGVRTVLQYNVEFFEYFVNRRLPWPDLLLAPSLWHFDEIDKLRQANAGHARHIHLPVPVDGALLREKANATGRRDKVKRILHTLGQPTLEDRNGTRSLLAAMADVTGAELTVRTQRRMNPPLAAPHTTVETRSAENYWELYDRDVDLYVMPRRFGGLCLPIQESLAQGIPVLMSDCSPQNRWLPAPMLMPGAPGERIQTRRTITTWNTPPASIAAAIGHLVDDPDLVAALSEWALAWGVAYDWRAWAPLYTDVLESLA